MKRLLLLLTFSSFFFLRVYSQLPPGSTAPNWTLTDINGVTHTLYDYLDAGKTVFIDFSATWCGPCWNYHNSGNLENLYNQYGPDGTDEVMVFMIEGDASTGLDCLYGEPSCSGSQGNWVEGTPYPIINDSSQNDPYQINYWPTIYGICPNRDITEVGQASTAVLYAFAQACPAWVLTGTVTNVIEPSCHGGNNGSINISVAGGTPPYYYAWSNGESTQNIHGLTAGQYTCTITDAANNVDILGPIEVSEPDIAFTVEVDIITDAGCGNIGGNIFLSINGGYQPYYYYWSTGAISENLINIPVGFYSVSVTDGNGCEKVIENIEVQQAAPPIAMAAEADNISCLNPTVTLDGAGSSTGNNISYLWTTYNGNIISGANTLNPVVDQGGTYKLKVYDNESECFSFANVTVIENTDLPTVTAGENGELNCSTPQITLNGSGSTGTNFTIEWTTEDGAIDSGENTFSPIVSSAGIYTLTITNTENGCSASSSVTVNADFDTPEISAVAAVLTCINTEVEVCGSSTGENCTFSWEGPDDFTSDEQCFSTSNSGTYILSVTCENGCTATTEIEVMENITTPNADAGSSLTLTCSVQEVILDGSGSSSGAEFSFSWTTTDGNIVSGPDTSNPIVDAPGTYTLEVVDIQNGCESTDEVVVTMAPDIDSEPDIETQEISCFGESDGQITITPSGGTPPYSYEWSNEETGNSISNLEAGEYSITISDENLCQLVVTIQLSQPDELTVSIETTDQTESGVDNGTASADVSGGTQDYSFEWSTGETSQAIEELAPGNYSVIITDANGCTTTQSFVINSFDCSLQAENISSSNISCFGANDGTASITVTGGIAPFSYLWSNDETTSEISNLAQATYTVTVTDNANCSITSSVTISEPAALALVISSTDETSSEANDGVADIVVEGGTEPYTFMWSTGATNDTIYNLAPGQYSITVTDNNGCTIEGTVIINSFDCALSSSYSTTDVSCYGGNDGQATVTALSGVEPFTYLWSTGETGAIASGLTAGIVFVSTTDAAFCEVIDTIEIFEPEELAISFELVLNNCECFDAMITVSGGTMPYSFTWPNGNGECITSDTYITITDANNCTVIEDIIIPELPDSPSVELVEVINETDSQSNGSIDISVTGGTPPFSYEWYIEDDLVGTTEDITDLPASTYTVIVTDANGCASSLEIKVDNIVGIKDIPDDMDISIIPNPSNGKININFISISEDEISIKIFNGTGKLVKEFSHLSIKNSSVNLDLQNLSDGVYYMKISTRKGNAIKHIIIN